MSKPLDEVIKAIDEIETRIKGICEEVEGIEKVGESMCRKMHEVEGIEHIASRFMKVVDQLTFNVLWIIRVGQHLVLNGLSPQEEGI